MKHINFKLTAFALCLAGAMNATAQVEITATEAIWGDSSPIWGQCIDMVTGSITPVQMDQQDDAIHFTVWTNALKDTREFTIRHEQLAYGLRYLVKFQNSTYDCLAYNIRLTKNLFSFNDEYVLAIYLADGSGVLLNEKNEKVGEIPSGIIEEDWGSCSLDFILSDNTPFLLGPVMNDDDDRSIYSISCWADKNQALHRQADLTNDGEVDVADVSKIINIVLGRE